MIPYFDFFIDTKAKRSACFFCITLGLGIIFFLPYLKLAWILLHLETYQEVFALLQQGDLQTTYCSRVILSCLSMAQFHFFDVLRVMLSSMRLWEIVSILCWILLFQEHQWKPLRWCLFIATILLVGVVVICAYLGFLASSLFQVLVLIKGIAIALFVYSFGFLCLCITLFFYRALPAYRTALQYHVEEIE